VVAPVGDPSAFVIYISDVDGVTDARRAEADRLVARGAAVALVEINEFLKRQAASDDVECHYAFGDLEDLAHAAQRELRAPEWLWPVILGVGQGGTAAYLNIAQAPANTAAGAVSIGLANTFKSKLPFCPGAPDRGKAGESYTYAPMTDIPGRWTLVTAAAPDDTVAHFLNASQGTNSVVVPGGGQDQLFAAAADAVFQIAALPKPTLSSIPLVELPARSGDANAIFILISGDGGWRDIDKQIGEFLSQHGVHVIGIDSLRYFWKKKTPQEIASDLNRVVEYYTKRWKVDRVGLGGFSFGADVIPLAWKHLSTDSQQAIGHIVLLGLEPTAALEVTVSGWLGIGDSREIDVRPYLATLPKQKTMCFYGAEEKADADTACVFKELDGARRLERPGGHHFDGDYESVARIIRDAVTSEPSKP
jgi:type IV secretory pathway VirJ component